MEGQAEVQQPQVVVVQQPQAPDPFQGFLSVAKSEFGDDKPRDESGKFVSTKQPEAPKEEAQPQGEAPQEEQKEAASEETQVEAQPEPRKFKLKYKGEEKEVDETEAVELAQMGFDYRQKTMALAKEREELSAKTKAEIDAKAKAYEQQLEVHKQAVLKLVDQEAMTTDLNKLSQEDPAKALQLMLKRQQIVGVVQAIAQEQQRISAQKSEEAKTAFQKQVAEANEVLSSDIKGWGNDLYSKVLEVAVKDYGFKPEEANAIVDPRAIKVLHDAMQYRAAKAKPIAEKKSVPETPKVVKPGAGEKPDQKAEQTKSAWDKFRKSGRKEDAVGIFADFLKADGSIK